MKYVVIGDTHADPRYSNRRFSDAGQFVADCHPDKVIQIGDFGNVDSIRDGKNKLEMEGARYELDKECIWDAQADFFRPIKARKKKLPDFHLILGNHDVRPEKFVAQNPHLQGTIGIKDFRFEHFGWRVHPYLQYINLGGFRFVHFMQGKTGNPIALRTNFKSRGVSVVQGHTHEAHHYTQPFEDRRIHGIDVGCLIHPDMGMEEAWSNPTCHTYWRGLWIFDNVKDGDADFTRVRAETFSV